MSASDVEETVRHTQEHRVGMIEPELRRKQAELGIVDDQVHPLAVEVARWESESSQGLFTPGTILHVAKEILAERPSKAAAL